MGFWITLEKDGYPVEVEPHMEGGTIAVGGTCEADRDVTYNYSRFWTQALGPKPQGRHHGHYGLGPWLHCKTGAESIPILERGIANLDGERDRDYWAPTEGNAKHVLKNLLEWAKQHPDATWNIHGG